MKAAKYILTLMAAALCLNTSAQRIANYEKYGRMLNIGMGVGNYKYADHSMPVLHANYEIDVVKYLTLAPFVTFYTHRSNLFWGNTFNTYKNYSYRETVIPFGLKGSVYYDKLVNAGIKWDFNISVSAGVFLRSILWDNNYYGDKTVLSPKNEGFFLDMHAGARYHFNRHLGMFLDFSTGVSTFGLSVHL
ncbi:MAG TPA: hypothetical protein VII99_03085 [Bacteroidia bacterium]